MSINTDCTGWTRSLGLGEKGHKHCDATLGHIRGPQSVATRAFLLVKLIAGEDPDECDSPQPQPKTLLMPNLSKPEDAILDLEGWPPCHSLGPFLKQVPAPTEDWN